MRLQGRTLDDRFSIFHTHEYDWLDHWILNVFTYAKILLKSWYFFQEKKFDFEEDIEVIKPSLIIDDHVYYSARYH